MCVQEEITQGVVSLSVETGKMTADLLQKAVKKVLEEMQKKPSQRTLRQGKHMPLLPRPAASGPTTSSVSASRKSPGGRA